MLIRGRFHARNPKSWMLRFHTQTSGASLTAQQPDNNLVRDEMLRKPEIGRAHV